MAKLNQDEILTLMSSPQARERAFSTVDQSTLLQHAAKFEVTESSMKQLGDFFMLGHMLKEMKHDKYRYLYVFQRMARVEATGSLQILSITPEDIDDYSTEQVAEIQKLYNLVKHKSLQSVITQVENELLLKIK